MKKLIFAFLLLLSAPSCIFVVSDSDHCEACEQRHDYADDHAEYEDHDEHDEHDHNHAE